MLEEIYISDEIRRHYEEATTQRENIDLRVHDENNLHENDEEEFSTDRRDVEYLSLNLILVKAI